MPSQNQSTTGVMLSGGIDSAVLLGQILRLGRRVIPFYIRTGCVWQDCELAAVEKFLAAVGCSALSPCVIFELPVADLYGRHWSITGHAPPDRYTSDEAVFLPGRNPLLLLKPALWCEMHGVEQLALATLAANPFDDATPEFFASFTAMIEQATSGRVEIARPFERLIKRNVLELGRHLPLELTFSCIAPSQGMHCGECNKCAERQTGFRKLGLCDQTQYAKRIVSAAS
jgi:7-cyano-7-deazaguanine synthase